MEMYHEQRHHGNRPPYDQMHEAEAEPIGMGMFRVVCPHGCALGTSADSVTELGAASRIELHRLTTEPLRRLTTTPQERINAVWSGVERGPWCRAPAARRTTR